MDEEKGPRRLNEVPPAAMPEVLRVAAGLYATDQAMMARAEQRQKLVEATEEAGLPAAYLERAAGLVLARQDAHLRRRRRNGMLAAIGVAVALWAGWGIRHRPTSQRAASPHVASTPVTSVPTRETASGAARLEGARWSVCPAGMVENGLTPVRWGDGIPVFVTRAGRRCTTPQPETNPIGVYLYFDIEDARASSVRGPVYVVVEYFDALPAGRLSLEYDSAAGDDGPAKYRIAEERFGAVYLGTQTWRTAFFRLMQPRFANRQNAGADFRLTIYDRPEAETCPLFVDTVRLTETRPAGC